jgi:SlyX protein
MNERINKIEERIAHQEMILQELGDEVYQQQMQVEKLELVVRELSEKIKIISESSGSLSSLEEPPPHY